MGRRERQVRVQALLARGLCECKQVVRAEIRETRPASPKWILKAALGDNPQS
jgi:hypothetical protein